MDLNLLTALDALLNTASVAEAAQRMHLSPPAMSHTLARIRDALGDPILVRAGRRLVPTPRANALRDPVRKLVAEAKGLLQSDAGPSLDTLDKEFVVRGPEGMGIIYGAFLLSKLRERVPLARLRFIPESEGDDWSLREGRIDLDVGQQLARAEIRVSPLYRQSIVGVVRDGHPLLDARITLKRFLAHEHVAITQRGGVQESIDVALNDIGAARRRVLTVPTSFGAIMAVARTLMVACVPDMMARTMAAAMPLAVFRLPVTVPSEEVVQAWHPRDELDPAHRHLRECVAALPKSTTYGPLGRIREEAAHRALFA